MWRREIPHVLGIAARAVIGAAIMTAFTIGLALVRLTDGSDERKTQ